jgi:hypothetical protein
MARSPDTPGAPNASASCWIANDAVTLIDGPIMKLVRTDGGIGLLVELPAGAHVVDIGRSVGVVAAQDPVAGALINGTLKEASVWTALVNNWRHLRIPLAHLARSALLHPDDPHLAFHPFAQARQAEQSGIIALEITDAADLDIHDPTGRRIMERQFSAASAEAVHNAPRGGTNVQVVDFIRRDAPRTRRE